MFLPGDLYQTGAGSKVKFGFSEAGRLEKTPRSFERAASRTLVLYLTGEDESRSR